MIARFLLKKYKLVLVGRLFQTEIDLREKCIDECNLLRNQVVILGYVSDDELAQRRAAMDASEKPWKPLEHRERRVTDALKVFAMMATSADKGAVRDISKLKD